MRRPERRIRHPGIPRRRPERLRASTARPGQVRERQAHPAGRLGDQIGRQLAGQRPVARRPRHGPDHRSGPAGEQVAEWVLARRFPARWSGPSLDVNGNQVAMETLELVHNGFPGPAELIPAGEQRSRRRCSIVVDGAGVPPMLRFSLQPGAVHDRKIRRVDAPKAPGAESTPDPDYTSTNPATSLDGDLLRRLRRHSWATSRCEVETLFSWTRPTPVSRITGSPQPPL